LRLLSKLILESLKDEGITACKANRIIQTYKIIESVMNHVKEIEPTEK